jgi:PII-like signaling protein
MAVTEQAACRLLVYTSEDDRVGHRSLAEELVDRAREEGLQGATVWRGIEGFGRSGMVRTNRLPDVNAGMPLVVEIVDRADRVSAFLAIVEQIAPQAVTTTEPVHLSRHVTGGPLPFDDPLAGP